MCLIVYVISMTNISRKLISIIVLSILLVGVLTTISYFLITYEKEDPGDRSIIIKSDTDLISYGFPGDGTPENPYIIENLNIKQGNIEIGDTTKYLVVRNCFVSVPECIGFDCDPSSIELYENADGTVAIINNTITSPAAGIHILAVDSVLIKGNTFIECYKGIYISSGNNLTVQSNSFIRCDTGMNTGLSYISKMSDNSFIDCTRGMWVCSYNSLYVNNSFWNCRIICASPLVILEQNNTFENNTINGLKFGCFLNEANLLLNAAQYGQIYLVNCSFVNITNQYTDSSYFHIYLYRCSNISIFNCTFSGINTGITCDVVSNITLTRCLFINCSSPLYIYGSYNMELSYNQFSNSSNRGIYLKFSDCLIHHNSFISNNLHAEDNGDTNIWYDTILLEGNYWDTWNGVGSYNIPGDAMSNDPYPLSEPPV